MKLGLCCISEVIKEQRGIGFNTMQRKWALNNPQDVVINKWNNVINNNLNLLDDIIEHCYKSNIKHYRLSSSMFPLITDPMVTFLPSVNNYKEKIYEIGNKIRKYNLSVSSHPSQYVVLPSLNPRTVDNAIADLNLHGWLHDNLGLPADYSNPINIHIGISSYDEYDIQNNFMLAFGRLDDSVKSRLVLENDDKGIWNCETLYKYFGDDFPLTFDDLHFLNNPSVGGLEHWMDRYVKTWGGFTPIFHWSEGKADKPRSHADYFSTIPKYIKDRFNIIFECEVKAKDKAIFNVQQVLDKH